MARRLADYLLVETADGYRVVFALPELDPTFKGAFVLFSQIAATAAALSETDGQLRLIIPFEKDTRAGYVTSLLLHVRQNHAKEQSPKELSTL